MAAKLYITAAMLGRRGACPEQVALFRKTFGPDKVLVTAENLRKAAYAGLEISWPVGRPFWESPIDSDIEKRGSLILDESRRAQSVGDYGAVVKLYGKAAALIAKLPVGAA